jgi:peptidoglycan/xylan/chitin deacetylase (PgdA/CDA1 family)
MVPALLGAAALSGLAAWVVRGRSSRLLGPVIWRGPSHPRAIALTFDDGPSESTPALLDLLDEHQARATFFVCGENVRRLPSIARSIVARGHEIANHTDTHAPLYLKTPDFLRRQVTVAQQRIAAATGVAPTLFRPPYGCRWPGLAGVLEAEGLRAVMWTTIASDWRLPPEKIAARLLPAARPGAIFCLHDGRELR